MKSRKTIKKNLSLLTILFLGCLTGCAAVNSRFTKELHIETSPKIDSNQVEYLACKPQRAALRIGKISSSGNGFANFDDIIKKTKKEAAKLGGDFILAEDSGVDTSIVYSPGYSSYKSNSYTNYGTYSGYSSGGTAAGYSVGPNISTINRPWCVFSVWVYCPCQTGIRFDNEWTIVGFHLNSDAPSKGLHIGDKLIGIDNYDVSDEGFIQHMMKVRPGDQIKITVQRGSNRFEAPVTALVN